jgi:glycosyltransferase involved in cell wall biosynthesis
MKRLLVLNYEWPPLGGGASPVSKELAVRLAQSGEYDIDVVTMRYRGLPAYEEFGAHLRVHRVWSLRSKKEICHPWEQLTYLVSGYLKARALHKAKPYDICHTHFIIPTGVIARALKRRYGLPYIITSHGSDVLGYNTRFTRLYPYLVGAWRRIIDEAKTITTPSRFLAEEIVKVHPPAASKITVIPNGIDTGAYETGPKEKIILSAGRLLRTKGFQHLIQAVSSEDIGYEVHIAGDGPLREELERLAKESKTKIVFHGWLDNKGEEYRWLLRRASVFVLASEKENASMALLEAMASGCAIVTTTGTGTAETVGEAGLLVPFGDSDRLRDALSRLAADESLMHEKQARVRERVESNYSWPTILSRFSGVL